MQKNTKLYIAYGSNMNIEQMKHRCPTAKVVTGIYLEGYRLRFMGGEGYPHLYHKETIEIKLGKKTFPAMVYILNGEKMLYGHPSDAYFEIIREGYIAAGFDPKLLHQAVAENLTEVRIYG